MQPLVELKELVDSKHWDQANYGVAEQIDGVWHARVSLIVPSVGELTAKGAGGSKQEARNSAAADLLLQLQQLGHCTPRSRTGAQPTTQASNSYVNRLQEFLHAPGRRSWRAVYGNVQLVPSSLEHVAVWTATVSLLDDTGETRLTATGKGSGKMAAKQQAAGKLLHMQEFDSIFFTSQATAAPTAHATGPSTPTDNYKNQLQELLHAASSKGIQGWVGWQLPVYSTTRVGPDHASLFTGTAVLQGPTGQSLTAEGPQATCKRTAEQLAAAALLQAPQLQQLQSVLQQQELRLASCSSRGSRSSSPSGGAAVQRLNELVAQAAWCMEELEPVPVRGHEYEAYCLYEAAVVINGYTLAVGHGYQRGEARAAAAHAALQCMGLAAAPAGPAGSHTQHSRAAAAAAGLPGSLGWAAQPPPPPAAHKTAAAPGLLASKLTAEVQHLSLLKFDQLAQHAVRTGIVSGATVNNTVVCGFVLQQPGKPLEVVALGTGTGFCAQSEQQIQSAAQRGQLLLDSHAEVVARRSLLRWLYSQAQLALQQQQQCGTYTTAAAPADAVAASVLEAVPPAAAAAAAAAALPGLKDSSTFSNASSSSSSGITLRFKPGVKLHMYISKPPCGDACIFNRPSHKYGSSSRLIHFSHAKPHTQRLVRSFDSTGTATQQRLLPSAAALAAHWPQNCSILHPAAAVAGCGLLRGKVLQGENCSPLPGAGSSSSNITSSCRSSRSISDDGSSDSMSTSSSGSSSALRLRKMCCSDKVARWNALGLQGSLLSTLLQPVYCSSIIIGGPAADYCEGAVSRAVCCRLAPHVPCAPAPPALTHSPRPPPPPRHACLSATSYKLPFHQQQQQQCSPATAAWQKPHSMTPYASDPQYQQPQQQQLLLPNMARAIQRGLHLPAPFHVNHPELHHAPPAAAGTPAVQAGGHGSTCSNSARESFNWNAAEPQQLEVTSADQGTLLRRLTVASATAGGSSSSTTAAAQQSIALPAARASSRLSKQAMFACYMQLQQQQQLGRSSHPALLAASGDTNAPFSISSSSSSGVALVTYASAKASTQLYSEAKVRLYQHFQGRTGQQWMQRKEALPQLEQFTASELASVNVTAAARSSSSGMLACGGDAVCAVQVATTTAINSSSKGGGTAAHPFCASDSATKGASNGVVSVSGNARLVHLQSGGSSVSMFGRPALHGSNYSFEVHSSSGCQPFPARPPK